MSQLHSIYVRVDAGTADLIWERARARSVGPGKVAAELIAAGIASGTATAPKKGEENTHGTHRS